MYLQISRLVHIYPVNNEGLVLFANGVRFDLRISVLFFFNHISLEMDPFEGVLLFP